MASMRDFFERAGLRACPSCRRLLPTKAGVCPDCHHEAVDPISLAEARMSFDQLYIPDERELGASEEYVRHIAGGTSRWKESSE